MGLLRREQITGTNIETAPLRLLSAIMEGSASGEQNPEALAEMALNQWNREPSVLVH
jgi:hypothetical protein